MQTKARRYLKRIALTAAALGFLAAASAANAQNWYYVNGQPVSPIVAQALAARGLPFGHYWLRKNGNWGIAGNADVVGNIYGRRPSLSERGLLYSPANWRGNASCRPFPRSRGLSPLDQVRGGLPRRGSLPLSARRGEGRGEAPSQRAMTSPNAETAGTKKYPPPVGITHWPVASTQATSSLSQCRWKSFAGPAGLSRRVQSLINVALRAATDICRCDSSVRPKHQNRSCHSGKHAQTDCQGSP